MNNILKLPSLLGIFFSVILTVFTTNLKAQTVQVEDPMNLRTIMEKLGHDMETVTRAISTEDWLLISKLAPEIAHHAEPPMSEKVQILTWLGTDAGEFRSFDMQVQEAATEMGEAAKQADGQRVIGAFAKTQQSCLACHQSFRQPFIKRFYGER
ncbi:MAG: cytochrome c [Pusillimonas sp.]